MSDKQKINITSILELRKNMLEKANSLSSQMEDYFSNITESYVILKSQVKKLVESDHIPYKVAREIIEKNMKQIDALSKVHSSLYHIQEINVNSITLLQDITEYYTQSKIIYQSLKTDLINNEDVIKMGMSKTSLTQEVEFVMNHINKLYKQIEMRHKQCKVYIDVINESLSQLNRLDSMLRLKNSMISNIAMETITNQGTIEL